MMTSNNENGVGLDDLDNAEIGSFLSQSEREAIARYRKRHPEKVQKWRFNSSLSYCRRYVEAHPEAREELVSFLRDFK